MSETKPERAGLRFLASVTADLDSYLADPSRAASEAAEALATLPADVAAAVDAILNGKKTDSYRDGLMIQFGFGLVSEDFVHVERAPGGRPAAAALGTVLASRHTSGVRTPTRTSAETRRASSAATTRNSTSC